ncbi:MAG: prepilin peptidase, partial [Lentisphaeria bacterium]|nr:prepilin peptidase [Lentisphaeria bacterium]
IAIVALSNIIIGVYALFIASLLGVIAGVIIARKQKKSIHKMTIPFGPFLAIGSIIAMLII